MHPETLEIEDAFWTETTKGPIIRFSDGLTYLSPPEHNGKILVVDDETGEILSGTRSAAINSDALGQEYHCKNCQKRIAFNTHHELGELCLACYCAE